MLTRSEYGSVGLPPLMREYSKGSNMGNKLGDIALPNYGLNWQLPLKQKVDVHGPTRHQVGGTVEGEEDVGRGARVETPQTVEPVFLWVNLAMCSSGRPCCSSQTFGTCCKHALIRCRNNSGILMWGSGGGGEQAQSFGLEVSRGELRLPSLPSRSSGMPARIVAGAHPLLQVGCRH